ncbi:helicase associated domain-containing protein [Streptomyces sp. NPDC059916]|uniref:helicase associated domain-containing protein n=1 Tax=Streptomyces sp. NPDC059916 TaxID=3347001 RepID=UPI0036CE63AF
MVANWVSFNVIDTERQDWARGWAALKKFTERELHARVPYGHKEGATPLGQWVAEQRRAYGAGEMSGPRARRLEQLGMVWSVADERLQRTWPRPGSTTKSSGHSAHHAPPPHSTNQSGNGSPTSDDPTPSTNTQNGRPR